MTNFCKDCGKILKNSGGKERIYRGMSNIGSGIDKLGDAIGENPSIDNKLKKIIKDGKKLLDEIRILYRSIK